MTRAVGYCENVHCKEYLKGIFLLNHGNDYNCHFCMESGFIEREEVTQEGDFKLFRTVKLNFDYDASSKRYRQLALVTDECTPCHYSTLVIKSPLVKTERRALKLAEMYLGRLAITEETIDNLHQVYETQFDLSWNREKFSYELNKWEKELTNSNFLRGTFNG
jgi:hypothetical protein